VAIDDCGAAVPPSNATVVVSTKGGGWPVPTVTTIDAALDTGAKVIAIVRASRADTAAIAGGRSRAKSRRNANDRELAAWTRPPW
jgi:hypothetical protein